MMLLGGVGCVMRGTAPHFRPPAIGRGLLLGLHWWVSMDFVLLEGGVCRLITLQQLNRSLESLLLHYLIELDSRNMLDVAL